MIIRCNNDDITIVTMTRCHYDGLTMCKIDTRSQNENELSRELRSIFLHAKDFAFAHEVAAEAWKIQPAVTRWVKMASRMARCFQDQTQIWTFSYSCVHLLSNSLVLLLMILGYFNSLFVFIDSTNKYFSHVMDYNCERKYFCRLHRHNLHFGFW